VTVGDRIPFWLKYALLAALGFVIAAILPEWAWQVFVLVVVVTGWVGIWRRNRRRTLLRPPEHGWTAPLRDPGSDS
jgi:hypothetical protein